MRRKIVVLAFSIIVPAILVSCGPSMQTTVDTGGPPPGDVVRYQGPKARIAVAKFDCKAAKCTGAIGDGLADMLSTALFKSGRFVVLERGEGLREIQKELRLGQSGYVNKAQAPEIGRLEGADVLVIGAITAFEPRASGIGGGGVVVPFKVPLIGGAVVKKREAYIAADIRLVDVRTGRIINATSVEGRASSWRAAGGMGTVIGTIALAGGLGGYRNTPMEKAVRVMLESAIGEIATLVPENYYRYGETGAPVPVPAGYQGQPTPAGRIRGGAGSPPPRIIGGRRFAPGSDVAFFESFSDYEIGDVPATLTIRRGQVEVAEFMGKKWLRFLSDGTVYREVDLERSFAVEMDVYKPKESPRFTLAIGTSGRGPEKVVWGRSLVWRGVELASYEMRPGATHHLAVQVFGGKLRVFVDGNMVVNEPFVTPAGGKAPVRDGFLLRVKGVNIDEGRELLVTNVRVTYY